MTGDQSALGVLNDVGEIGNSERALERAGLT